MYNYIKSDQEDVKKDAEQAKFERRSASIDPTRLLFKWERS